MSLKIAHDLNLPVEMSGRRTAIFGISGSGKSNTATVVIEQLLRNHEQCVLIDPKGEGWGLLSLTNGKPSNLPLIVFGEPNGHIETLSENHGDRLADFVVESGRSVVLSLLGFESDQSERRFVATFLRQLYRRKSRQPHPTRTLVILEEAHLFIPESSGRGFGGSAAELSGAVQRIVRQGRSFGIGTLLVDQRPQDVAKRVITQCDTLICHQLVHKTDRDALRDWVRGYDRDGQGEQFLDSVAGLDPGQAWVWSPAWLKIFKRIKVNLRTTYDTGAAPSDAHTARTVQRAEVDLDQLRGQLAEVVEKAKADDPAELKKRIAELQRKLSERPAVEPQRIEIPVFKNGQLDRANAFLEKLENRLGTALANATTEIRSIAGDLSVSIAKASPTTPTPRPARPAVTADRPMPAAKPAQPATGFSSSPGSNGDIDVGRCERAILTALAQYPQGRSDVQIALLSGYSKTSGAFKQSLRDLGKAGLVTEEKPRRITPQGLQLLGDWTPLPTGQELRKYWLDKLGPCGRAILTALFAVYPEGLLLNDLSERTGYSRTSGAFKQELRDLAKLELITRGHPVKASQEFFQ